MVETIILLLVIIGIGGALAAMYNSLIKLRNLTNEGWAQIDVQLQRRNDLIPNLVDTVKGYAAHEKTTFEEVTRARNMSASASTVGEAAKSSNMLTQALGKLFAVAEAYPDLKASNNFLQLQEELATTENKIAFARQYYNNNNVRTLNTKIEVFPSNIIANMFKFEQIGRAHV